MTTTQVQHLRSKVSGARPGDGTIRWLFDGEFFINEADGIVCLLGIGGALTTLVSTAGLAGINALINALQAQLAAAFTSAVLGAAMANLPTTEPTTPGLAWMNNNALMSS